MGWERGRGVKLTRCKLGKGVINKGEEVMEFT